MNLQHCAVTVLSDLSFTTKEFQDFPGKRLDASRARLSICYMKAVHRCPSFEAFDITYRVSCLHLTRCALVPLKPARFIASLRLTYIPFFSLGSSQCLHKPPDSSNFFLSLVPLPNFSVITALHQPLLRLCIASASIFASFSSSVFS